MNAEECPMQSRARTQDLTAHIHARADRRLNLVQLAMQVPPEKHEEAIALLTRLLPTSGATCGTASADR